MNLTLSRLYGEWKLSGNCPLMPAGNIRASKELFNLERGGGFVSYTLVNIVFQWTTVYTFSKHILFYFAHFSESGVS